MFYGYFREMPPHSKTKSAIASDPDLARAQLANIPPSEIDKLLEKNDGDGKKPDIPLEGYTLEIAKLDEVINKISILTNQVKYLLADKNVQRVPPELNERPKSAFQKALDELAYAKDQAEGQDLFSDLGF